MIISSFKTVFTLVLLIGVGYLISHLGWYKKEDKAFLSHLIINVSIPALLIKTFFHTFPKKLLLESLPILLICFISMIITYTVACLCAKFLKLEASRKTSFSSLSTLSNAIFVGLPAAISIYGEESIPYVMIYYVAGTILLWGFFAPKFTDGKIDGENRAKSVLKSLMSIPLITIVISIPLSLSGFKMPNMILEVVGYLSGLSTPLSLIYIGGVIYEVGLKNMKMDISTLFSILIKFALAPIMVIILAKFIKLEELGIKTLAIVAGMPPMTQLGVVASRMKSEEEYVMTTIGFLTIISLIFIPINTSLVGYFIRL